MNNKSVEENALGGKENLMSETRLQDWATNEIHELIKTTQRVIDRLELQIEKCRQSDPNVANKNIEKLENLINVLKEVIIEKEQIREVVIPERKKDELLKDYDGDGLSNYEELQRGTNPYERDSDHDGIDDRYDKEMER